MAPSSPAAAAAEAEAAPTQSPPSPAWMSTVREALEQARAQARAE